MNIIDVLAILPYYLDLFMSAPSGEVELEPGMTTLEPPVEMEEEEEAADNFAEIQKLMKVFSILKILNVGSFHVQQSGHKCQLLPHF